MKYTLKDIARIAGVSITSVSLVLNNKPNKLSDKTRQRILEVATELDYRPNPIAQSLKAKKSNLIGLVIPDLTNPFFATMAKLFRLQFSELGLQLLTTETSSLSDSETTFIDMLLSYKVAGIIYFRPQDASFTIHNSTLETLEKHSIPFVILDSQEYGRQYNMVNVDNEYGGFIATEYLIEMGHRRIGCYAGPRHVNSSNLRLQGYLNGLAAHSIEDSFVFEGNYGLGYEGQALAYFIENGCTAIFALNDMMALGLYKVCKRRGVDIPNELSVVGFDNIAFGEVVYPELTTIDQRMDLIVRNAVEVLQIAMENGNSHQSRLIQPELLIRDSVARCGG